MRSDFSRFHFEILTESNNQETIECQTENSEDTGQNPSKKGSRSHISVAERSNADKSEPNTIEIRFITIARNSCWVQIINAALGGSEAESEDEESNCKHKSNKENGMLVLDAFDSIEERVLKIVVSTYSDHSGGRVDSQTYQ